MADSKISALPASSVPLAGTEVLPIVQSSTTKQVSVANLTAGRAISATQITLTTGSVIVASGQGIDFSATPGTGTSELLNDYEEGTWTPTYTSVGATFTYTEQYGSYIKIGSLVTAQFRINAASASGTTVNAAQVTGFPFSSANNGPLSDSAGAIGLNTFPGGQVCPQMAPNSTLLNLWISNTTGLVSAIQTVGSYCIVTVCYRAA